MFEISLENFLFFNYGDMDSILQIKLSHMDCNLLLLLYQHELYYLYG